MVTVGVPRALLYYSYYPLWQELFAVLGHRAVLSGQTTRGMLDAGVRAAVDEVCLPVKLFLGHAADLRDRVDLLFVPRLVRVERRAYVCPKFMGLPDMVRRALDGLPPLLSPCVDAGRDRKAWLRAAFAVGRAVGSGSAEIRRAHAASMHRFSLYCRRLQEGRTPVEIMEAGVDQAASATGGRAGLDVRVGLAGHPYNIYDRYASLDILGRLRHLGAVCVTPEMVEPRLIAHYAATLKKELYWTLGKRLVGASLYWIDSGQVDGIIHVTAFACGLDSVVGEFLERAARRRGIPFTCVVLDEHTGEAGLLTRLEAFVDMVVWRRREHAGHLSPHGHAAPGGQGSPAGSGS